MPRSAMNSGTGEMVVPPVWLKVPGTNRPFRSSLKVASTVTFDSTVDVPHT